MIIYIDKEFKCHASNDGTMTEVEVSDFDGMCQAYIEGYRYIPSGATYTENGVEYEGRSFFPWVESSILEDAQREYERQRIGELEAENTIMKAALAELGVTEDD